MHSVREGGNKIKLIFLGDISPKTFRGHKQGGGESLLIRAAHFPHLGCGKWAPENFRALVRGIIWKKIYFNIPSRKLGKNVNLFHLNMNFFKSRTEKVPRFLIAGMWKLSLDVENEPGCGKWAARIKWAFFKECFDENYRRFIAK